MKLCVLTTHQMTRGNLLQTDDREIPVKYISFRCKKTLVFHTEKIMQKNKSVLCNANN